MLEPQTRAALTDMLHPPSLHADRSGNLVSWGAGERLLRYLDQKLHEGDVTLETGAGLSTLVFAMKRFAISNCQRATAAR